MFRRSNKQKTISRVPPPPSQSNKIDYPSNDSSLKNSIVSGFGFGIGSSIAHKITDSVFDKPSHNNNNNNETKNLCNELKTKLNNCVTESNVDCTKLYENYFNQCT